MFRGLAFMQRPKHFGVRRLRYGWAVYDFTEGQIIIAGLKTKARADYVATVLMGRNVSTVFMCGELI